MILRTAAFRRCLFPVYRKRIEEGACMPEQEKKKRARVLDPVSRISEIIFGVLMALSFTGSLNVATAGHEEIKMIT